MQALYIQSPHCATYPTSHHFLTAFARGTGTHPSKPGDLISASTSNRQTCLICSRSWPLFYSWLAVLFQNSNCCYGLSDCSLLPTLSHFLEITFKAPRRRPCAAAFRILWDLSIWSIRSTSALDKLITMMTRDRMSHYIELTNGPLPEPGGLQYKVVMESRNQPSTIGTSSRSPMWRF